MEKIKTAAARILLVLTALLWALNSVGGAQSTPLQPPASTSRPPVILPTVAEMPKYKVGDSWTVRFADGRTSRRIVRAIEKDQYVFEWGSDLRRYYDQNLVLIKQVTPEDGKEVITSRFWRRTMEFPLTANKTWEFRYKISSIMGGDGVAGNQL